MIKLLIHWRIARFTCSFFISNLECLVFLLLSLILSHYTIGNNKNNHLLEECRIQGLPIELLECFLSFLQHYDVLGLRSTSRLLFQIVARGDSAIHLIIRKYLDFVAEKKVFVLYSNVYERKHDFYIKWLQHKYTLLIHEDVCSFRDMLAKLKQRYKEGGI